MNVRIIKILLSIFIIFLLSGCMYPDKELTKNNPPNDAQLKKVQAAVDQYKKEENGLIPIETRSEDTSIFKKYIIDYDSLIQNGYLDSIPANAFENGGFYEYTILDPEDHPTVKLIDLRVTDQIRNYNVKLDIYRSKHTYPPFGKEISKGFYEVDYKKLRLDKPLTVNSPYSTHSLPVIIDEKGNLIVDYSIELYEALNKYEHTYKKGNDIRFILTDHTPFVPTQSVPYTVEDGEPILLNE